MEAQILKLVPDGRGVGTDVFGGGGGGGGITVGLDLIASLLIIHQALSFKCEPQAPLSHSYSVAIEQYGWDENNHSLIGFKYANVCVESAVM